MTIKYCKILKKVADYVIQFLRTYLEHIAARIYAHENPNKQSTN